MLHGNNPVLKMCAANSKIIMDPAGNRKLDKQKSTGRIDGMVALAMAVGVMPQDKAVESNYNKRGIIFI
jgi:phage terminase large subunit-like protein